MTTNTAKHAQRELDILVASATDPNNRPIIEPFIPEILSLCEKFGLSGQSGGSAPFTATALSQAIKKLCLQEPICPMTGIDEEWADITEISKGKKLYQNIRCSGLFKDENGAYFLDGILFKLPNGNTIYCNGVKMKDGSIVTSKQRVKSFPFTPKTFYIDVIEEEVAPDDWEFTVKHPRQVLKVWKYYDKF